MKRKLGLLTSLLIFCISAIAQANALDITSIQKIIGIPGTYNSDQQVLRIEIPRDDFGVRAAGVLLAPSMGLKSWLAFKPISANKTLLMGALVLTEDQVNAVLSVALNNNLDVTELHNHFLFETPRLMFLHIEAIGDATKLASASRLLLDKIQATGNMSTPTIYIDPSDTHFDTNKISTAFGYNGNLIDGVYRINIPQQAHIDGITIGSAMGIQSMFAFAGTNEKAVAIAELIVRQADLQPVLKTLRAANIDILAIHIINIDSQQRWADIRAMGTGKLATLVQAMLTVKKSLVAPLPAK